MGLTGTESAITLLCGVAIVVGIFGSVVPLVPGLAVSWTGVLLWAVLSDRGSGVWITFGIATILALTGLAMKYLVPGRRLQRGGVPNRALVAGGLLGIIGFFVVPVVGLVLGFVLGIFLAELVRLNRARLAWPSTWRAIKAVGLSMLIEIGAGLCILAVWLGSLYLL